MDLYELRWRRGSVPEALWLAIQCRDNHRVNWRSSRTRVTLLTIGLAVIAAGACAVVAVSDTGDSGGLRVFNACIAQRQFLLLVHHGNQHGVIETLRDRKSGALVGEIAANNRVPRSMLGGAAAATNRYLMSTATPLGRDPSAIEDCWDSYSPVAPR
jgi:hypothetical protein